VVGAAGASAASHFANTVFVDLEIDGVDNDGHCLVLAFVGAKGDTYFGPEGVLQNGAVVPFIYAIVDPQRCYELVATTLTIGKVLTHFAKHGAVEFDAVPDGTATKPVVCRNLTLFPKIVAAVQRSQRQPITPLESRKLLLRVQLPDSLVPGSFSLLGDQIWLTLPEQLFVVLRIERFYLTFYHRYVTTWVSSQLLLCSENLFFHA
jgi:hypothetical protein